MRNLNDKLDRVESELIDKVEVLEKELVETRARSISFSEKVSDLREEVRFLRKVIEFVVNPNRTTHEK